MAERTGRDSQACVGRLRVVESYMQAVQVSSVATWHPDATFTYRPAFLGI